jgi:hypothetical protein
VESKHLPRKQKAEVWEYIANNNLVGANRVLGEIYQILRSLVTFPTGATVGSTSPHGRCGFNQYANM